MYKDTWQIHIKSQIHIKVTHLFYSIRGSVLILQKNDV